MLCCQGALTVFHKAWLAVPFLLNLDTAPLNWTQSLVNPLEPCYCPTLASLIHLHPLKSLGKCKSAPHITCVKSHPKNRRPGPEDWHGKTINQDEPGSTENRNSTFPPLQELIVAHHPPQNQCKNQYKWESWSGARLLVRRARAHCFSFPIWIQLQQVKPLKHYGRQRLSNKQNQFQLLGFNLRNLRV